MTDIHPEIPWNPKFHLNRSIFSPVIPAIEQLVPGNTWPSLNDFQHLISHHSDGIYNSEKKQIQFVEQADSFSDFDSQYEPRIYLKGEVQTRLDNWHDFFQVLVWYSFPKIKAILNQCHFNAAKQRLLIDPNNKQRSSIENFLTLFDECGIVIISNDNFIFDLIKNFKWKSLFIDNRAAYGKSWDAVVFGHAMYEKALNPYIGMTAQALFIKEDSDYFNLSSKQKTIRVDEIVTSFISKQSELSPSLLNPFPLLGVPEWHSDQSLEFYNNTNYFRTGRRRK